MTSDSDDSDEELGAYIYSTSLTAQRRLREEEERVRRSRVPVKSEEVSEENEEEEEEEEAHIAARVHSCKSSTTYTKDSCAVYDPAKHEETDDEATEPEVRANENYKVKNEADVRKAETDDEVDYCHLSRRRKSPRLANKNEASPILAPGDNLVMATRKKRGSLQANHRGQKRRRCSHEGCTKYARDGGGVCVKHGASWKHYKTYCSHKGCTSGAINKGVCIKHGASWTKKKCSHEGCPNFSQKGGVCKRHGGYRVCKYEGCTKHVQREGLCIKHAARKECKVDGCINQDYRADVCSRHYNTCVRKCSMNGGAKKSDV